MTVRWCLTPMNQPNTHLHGPYDTYEQATTTALTLLSDEAKNSVAYSVRRPVALVPTPCTGVLHGIASYTPTPTLATRTVPAAMFAAPAPVAPPAIYRLTESKLRFFAASLGIVLPPTANTRAAIIAILAKELDL